MWRVLLYLLFFGVAAYGAIWLADHPETLSVTWAGREYTTSLATGVVGIVVLAMLLSLVWALVRFVLHAPSSLRRRSGERKRDKGMRALSRGIVAVGAGDVTAARRYASEAERLVGPAPLALLLKAQAAQASGDRAGAETAFRRMADNPETRVLGLRGLFVEARRRGDGEAAREHATEAARLAPAIAWANDAMLDGYSAEGDWAAATRLVERRTSLGLIDRATSQRQRAVLRTADALALDEKGLVEPALAAALDAVRLAPGLVPAAALAGRLLSRRGDLKRAAKVVEAAWRANPHPDLAAAYLDLRPGDSAIDRLRRAETLARLSSWSPESRLAIARTAIDARQTERARSTIAPLLDGRPTMRVCLMMAELEGVEGHAGRVREWLARAARAPRDAAWIADGIVSERWAPVSPVSGRLDAFVWETPPEILGAPTAADLPFIDEPEPEPEPIASLPPPATVAAPVETPPAIAAIDPEKPAPHAEVAGAAGPRSTHDRGASFEADLRPAPQDEEVRASDKPVPPPVVEPAPVEPLRRAGSNGGGLRQPMPAREPAPVVFPVPHAPDDPGLEAEERRRQSRFRQRGR